MMLSMSLWSVRILIALARRVNIAEGAGAIESSDPIVSRAVPHGIDSDECRGRGAGRGCLKVLTSKLASDGTKKDGVAIVGVRDLISLRRRRGAVTDH